MHKLLKYFKPYTLPLIVMVLILLVQVSCDLALPEKMSTIVNIGIARGGFENYVPEALSKNSYNQLMGEIKSENEKKIFQDSYSFFDSEENLNLKAKNKFANLELNNSYLLRDLSNESLDELSKILITPEAKIHEASSEDLIVDKNDDFQKYASTYAIEFLKSEYSTLGSDILKIQNNYIYKSGAIMLGFSLISMFCIIAVAFISSKVSASFARTLRHDIYSKVVSFSSNEFSKFSPASLITRCTNDVQQVQQLTNFLRMLVFAPILAIGGIYKVNSFKTSLTSIIFFSCLTIIAVVVLLFSNAIPKFKLIQKITDKLNLLLRESLSGIMVIRAFNTQEIEKEKFDETNTYLFKTFSFIARIMSLAMPLMSFIMNITIVIILWYGAKQINIGVIQIGDLMAFNQYTMTIMMSFLMISMISIMIPRASVSALRISEVLETEPTILDPENPLKTEEDLKGTIEFENVSFKYPDSDTNVINNISFKVNKGETFAFIGSTGSGKSTIVNLIPRFYDVTEGRILFDGVDIRSISQDDLREKIGYIPQKSFLFSGTIESNIKFGGDSITDEEMVTAAKISQSYDFISKKEEQFQSEISQGGTNISGGQRQRLSIARAIAINPEVYIFDDSFSALDFQTDKNLRQALKEELSSSTVLIVAQRISTIRNADKIIVLNEGLVVGTGTHKELMSSCDVYREIALSQLSEEELEDE